MSYWKIKLRPADTIFSQYLRKKHGRCEICGRSDIKLEAAHFYSRRNESVRFDEENVHCLCFTCHRKSHEDKSYYEDWIKKKLGQKRFDLLTLRAHTTAKKDDEAIKIYYRNKLKELNKGEI